MMLDNRSDLFKIEFFKGFIPDEIKERWNPYLQRLPHPIRDVSDLIHWSIQSMNLPSISYDVVLQKKSGWETPHQKGWEQTYRSSKSEMMLFDKNLQITFKLTDGAVNYFVLMETFWWWYDFENTSLYTKDLLFKLFDVDGINTMTYVFKDILFRGIGELSLSYSDNVPQFKTFTIDLTYNEMQTQIQKI